MRYELFIALRYLLARRKERFISIISLISIAGIAVGVTALIVVIAVMTGFDLDLQEKILGINSPIIIQRHDGIENPEEIISKISSIKQIKGASEFIAGQGIIKNRDVVSGVLIKGVVAETEAAVSKIKDYVYVGRFDFEQKGIVIGSELARKLNIFAGDEIELISPIGAKSFHFKVRGVFKSGMYDYDLNLVYIGLSDAQEFFDAKGKSGAVGLSIENVHLAEKIKSQIQKELGFPLQEFQILTWADLNRNLFSALKLEKIVMFIILTLIVIVACFNIISTLIMTVMEKIKDIGILKSIGATKREIGTIFTFVGFIIGVIGTGLGGAFGFLLCILLKKYKFIDLPKDIYYIDKLPVSIQWKDSVVIIACAIIITLLATIYPAWQAAKLKPVDALRYE